MQDPSRAAARARSRVDDSRVGQREVLRVGLRVRVRVRVRVSVSVRVRVRVRVLKGSV